MQARKWKKKLGFLLLAVSVGTSCVNVSYGKENSTGETSAELTESDVDWNKDLYALKTTDIDTEIAGDIAEKLEIVGWWPENQNWFIGADDTGVMEISFQSKIEDRECAEHQMMLAGTVLLALFDDLTEINFSYILENNHVQVEYGMCWDLEAAQEALRGKDVKSYGTSEDNFTELIKVLQDW